jgi:hypothetical protein
MKHKYNQKAFCLKMEEQINPGRDGPEGMLYSSISFSIKIMQKFFFIEKYCTFASQNHS